MVEDNTDFGDMVEKFEMPNIDSGKIIIEKPIGIVIGRKHFKQGKKTFKVGDIINDMKFFTSLHDYLSFRLKLISTNVRKRTIRFTILPNNNKSLKNNRLHVGV